MVDIQDWFEGLANEIDRRASYRMDELDASTFHGIVVDALRDLGKKMREPPVVDTLASGTTIAQRPRAILTITPGHPVPPIELTLDTDAQTLPIEEPDLPGPYNKNAYLATFQNRLAEICDESRMGTHEIATSPRWRLERLLGQIDEARSSIEAVAAYVRWHLARDPG